MEGNFLGIAALVSYHAWTTGYLAQDMRNAGTLQAFIVAHRQAALCGLGVSDIGLGATGGYAFLHRDVPLYYSPWHGVDRVEGSGIELVWTIMLKNKAVMQYPGIELLGHPDAYNFLIASSDRAFASFTPVACFETEPNSPWPTVCLLQRSGGCSLPREDNVFSVP